ncbi:hypothetical protein A4X09_0g6972 [Tilletia walkeri]|uniref:Uncharacterized protein n=1 Tax=Tilletia walkeri TaxID=117179 RepID=A0A8X7N2Z2_9BASI|nr:hypothetical protein A4X09_0g6972 [Tilletia walkeri]
MLAREQFKKRRSPPGGFGRSRAALELSNIFLRHLRGGTKEEVDKILNDPEANHYGVCIQPLTLVATDFDETNTDLEAQQAKGLELCSQIKPQQEQLVIAQYHLNRTKSSAAKSIADERQRKDVWVEELWVALGEEERGRRVVEQDLDKARRQESEQVQLENDQLDRVRQENVALLEKVKVLEEAVKGSDALRQQLNRVRLEKDQLLEKVEEEQQKRIRASARAECEERERLAMESSLERLQQEDHHRSKQVQALERERDGREREINGVGTRREQVERKKVETERETKRE